ncbi:hypothetical protein CDD81_1943 [Ophiocordyceps australis]|uniref:TATA-binding protein interacting (TIP20) domain-containing protein n=1 Tax=Ophiocordyceps australis TaxID=1399860 RepID=A0A2C5XXX2_9HYPO|nr:hypothetical protein CDD81_1943 [Ophiocordyceps australis]
MAATAAHTNTASPATTPQLVQSLVRRLGDADPDFRFMSLNDLLQLLEKSPPEFLHHEYNIAARSVDSIIKALDDQNSEVQNLAIKCLKPLVPRIPPAILSPMLDKLSSLRLQNSVDSTVPSLAIRSVIMALPRPVPGLRVTQDIQQAYEAIQRVLIPRLIGPGPMTRKPDTSLPLPPVPTGLLQDKDTVNTESVDVLIELVRCFGPMLEPVEVEATLYVVLEVLENPKASSVVKKRVVVAVSMLAVYLNNDQLEELVKGLRSLLSNPDFSPGTKRLYVSILGSIARSIPTRFGPHLSDTAPRVLEVLSEENLQQHKDSISDGADQTQEFNEICEAALATLEAFLASCPQEMKKFTNEIITASLRFIKYDPNSAIEEDDDTDMDNEEQNESDADDEFDDDGFDDDDDDASWKVRRCAVKTIYTLIVTRGSGDLLDNGILYSQTAPALIKRLDEREENVRLEVISALSLLIRKTGEGLHLQDTSLNELEPEMQQIPQSRKRRRQSSGGSCGTSRFMAAPGLTSPVADKLPLKGPQADLARLTPSILKAAVKHLKGRTVPTKQAIINMLDDLVSVQRGGLSENAGEVINLVAEEARNAGATSVSSHLAAAGGAASATVSTLRIAALRLISDICKTHSSSLLKPHLAKMVDAVTVAVHDKFYKISSEAIRTVEELIKTITPPRSRNSGVEYKQELEKLFQVIVDKGSASDADAEVRERAIHALGIVVSRTSSGEGVVLLSAEKRHAALDVLRDRLKNETTRLAAVRAIDNVAALAVTPGQLKPEWVQDVALELSAQLRKSNRTLRGSSIIALKHLVVSPAAKDVIEPETVKGIVSALLPAITNSDTHLLGPALVVLAQLVPNYAELVVTQSMIAALCQLLKSHFANIVLDPLLELMSVIGQSGVTKGLMHGLLTDVSVTGDPSVVGKVMGTLLVTGGESTGHTLDSFTTELQTSAKCRDDARVSLALSVLGEASMRLGSKSPIKPQLFLEQFHDEPDRVSLVAAISLGRAGSGNVSEYLPVILETMKQQGGDTRQYLLIQSIKEILQSISVQTADLREYGKAIWEQLLKASEHADNRVVCAECVGCLAILDSDAFMPRLEALLRDESLGIRGMAVQAVRYTLPESDEAFDARLKDTLINMLLVMLQDSDMDIRRLAMSTLNSAAHNKPDLILPHLNQLMPFVLGESVIKPQLIKEVMLGPFKHMVDDGLEVRKGAYETLYALMDTAFTRINNIELYDRVVAGLKDENDIRQLCNLMVMKLLVLDPSETVRRLDTIAEAYRSVLSIKLKENAVKQDVEKQEEANKSVLRVTLLLGEKMKGMNDNGGTGAGTWASYWEWVNKDFDKQLKGLHQRSKELQTRMA